MCWGNQNRYEGRLVRVALTEGLGCEVLGASPQGATAAGSADPSRGMTSLPAHDAAGRPEIGTGWGKRVSGNTVENHDVDA